MSNSTAPPRDVVNQGTSSVDGGIITARDTVHATHTVGQPHSRDNSSPHLADNTQVKPEAVGAVGGASKLHTLSQIREAAANAEKNGQGRYSPLSQWEKETFEDGAWHLQQCHIGDE